MKYILTFVLLFCIGGRLNNVPNATKGIIKTNEKFYEAKRLAQDDQDEVPKFKKRYKAKGLQVIVPLIPGLTFKKFRLLSKYTFAINHQAFSSFLYCAKHKRGPPSLNA